MEVTQRRYPTRIAPGRSGARTILLALLAVVLISNGAIAEEPIPPGEEADPNTAASGESSTGATQPETATSDDATVEWEIDGYLKERFRYRHVESENDLDLLSDLAADLTHHGEFPFRLRFNGRLLWDIVGNQHEDDLLRDYWDSFNGELQGRIYEAYGQLDDLADGVLDIRLGRQFIEEGSWFHFDGIRLDADLGELVESMDATVIFGVPVIITDAHRRGNWLGGFVVRKSFDTGTRARLEYYHVSEDIDGYNDPVVDPLFQPETIEEDTLHDDYWGLSVWQRLGDSLRLFGRFSLLNGDANELNLRARWTSEEGVFSAVIEYEQLFNRLRDVTNDLSPYVPLLGSYEPFWKLGGRIDYRPNDDWMFQAGYSHRDLTSDGDEGTFNHQYDHYFANATRFGLLEDRLDLSLFVNGYDSSFNDVVAIGGQADFRLSSEVTAAGGVDYALFKYDFFTDTERENVWTYWLDLRWKESKDFEVRGRFSLDDDEYYTYVTVELSLIVRF